MPNRAANLPQTNAKRPALIDACTIGSPEDMRHHAPVHLGRMGLEQSIRIEHRRAVMPSINARAGVFLSFVTVALVGAAGCNSGVGPAAGSPSNRSGSCPNAQDTFSKMLPTTYAIGVAYELGNNELGYYSVGTAFAIDRRLLATNGHVARGVLDAGKQVRVVQAYAVQHGTGQVLELTRALIHPDYQTGKSTSTPDVALFTTKEEMTEWLDLATEEDVADIQPGDAVYATSFPGDVEKVAPVIPGQTVPQATALTGAITALRSYQQDVLVDATNTDIIQHQLPTSAGCKRFGNRTLWKSHSCQQRWYRQGDCQHR